MKTISKSNFVSFKRCPRYLWLFLNAHENYVESPGAQHHIESGKQVGDLAKRYFENTVDATALKADGTLDIQKMIENTNTYLSENRETIAEASFSVDGLFCSVDLLHKVNDGYEIYEVKASSSVKKKYLFDSAFQKIVLQKAGLNVVGVYVLHLNNEYVRHGELNLSELFIAEKVDGKKAFLTTLNTFEEDMKELNSLLSRSDAPAPVFCSECNDCPFEAYCKKDLKSPNIFDLQAIGIKPYDMYKEGIVTFEDIIKSGQKLNRFQQNQIDCYLNNKETIIDKEAIKSFLKKLKYPLYHFDFETIKPPIPPVDGTRPDQTIPTQYSLHIEYEDGRLEHKEFLGTTIDPRRKIAESICQNIPADACVLAYSKSYECGQLTELAKTFEDLRDHLNKIADNIVDLAEPFQKGYFYHKDMKKKYSIKAVLPALCPNDPNLDYHALPVVHKGDEAMEMYPKMLEAEPKEKERIRDGLLQYCCLDTLAMVMILRKIREQI